MSYEWVHESMSEFMQLQTLGLNFPNTLQCWYKRVKYITGIIGYQSVWTNIHVYCDMIMALTVCDLYIIPTPCLLLGGPSINLRKYGLNEVYY